MPSRFHIQPGRHGTSTFTHYIPCVCVARFTRLKYKCNRKGMENFPFLASALVFVFALRLFKRVFARAFAYVCVARVNRPYELFYSADVTNFIY